MPPKPPRALPEAEEDKEFSETKELLNQMHAQYTKICSLEKTPSGGPHPGLKKKKILMETILQIKSVSLVTKWGILLAMSCQAGTTSRANTD